MNFAWGFIFVGKPEAILVLAIMITMALVYCCLPIAYKFCKYFNFKFIERIDFYLPFIRYYLRADNRKQRKSNGLPIVRPLRRDKISMKTVLCLIFLTVLNIGFCLVIFLDMLRTNQEQLFHKTLQNLLGISMGKIVGKRIMEINELMSKWSFRTS